MPGTKIGGLKAAATNKKRDPDFYIKIGKIGGAKGRGGGFGAGEEGRERARIAGRLGGQRSSRRKNSLRIPTE